MRRSFLLLGKLHGLLRAPPRGLAAVEFGLAAPILILLLVGLVDFGMGFYDSLQVQGAASAGAQYATIHAWSTANIQAAVASVNSGITATAPAPLQVCGCPIYSGSTVTNLQNAIDLKTVNVANVTAGTTVAPGSTTTALGSCSTPTAYTCSCTTPKGTPCAAGLYAVVVAKYSYSPMLPYPWTRSPLTLSGLATRQLQ